MRNGQDVTPRVQQVTHGGFDFFGRLPHAQNQVRFCDEASLLRCVDDTQRTVVTKRRPDCLHQARNRFQIMSEHLRPGFEYLCKGMRIAFEVIDQQFDTGTRLHDMDLSARFCVEPRGSVFKVVSTDACDRHIAQSEFFNRLSQALGLIPVVFSWPSGGNIAEVASTRTQRSTNQEGSLTVLPTFVDIRAVSFCADGVQSAAMNQLLHILISRPIGNARLQPCGTLLFDRRLRVALFDASELAAFRFWQCRQRWSSLRCS